MPANYEHGIPVNRVVVVGTLAGGATYEILPGDNLLAVFSADVDTPDLRVQVSYAPANWYDLHTYDMALWAGIAGVWVPVPTVGKASADMVRLENSGVNPVTTIFILVT